MQICVFLDIQMRCKIVQLNLFRFFFLFSLVHIFVSCIVANTKIHTVLSVIK